MSDAVPQRLTVLTIGARDIDRLQAFYEALGWQSHRFEDFCRFATAGATLGLFPIESLAAEAGVDVPPPGGFSGVTLAINADARDGVDAAYAAALAAGARGLAEPVDRDWGGRSCYFADPEGNVWEIAWVPGSSFEHLAAMTWSG